MGEIAESMISGESCEGCGEFLDCEICEGTGIPAYCSAECARNRGASKEQICKHQ